MKKYLLFCFPAVILLSCTQVNSTGEKKITQGRDTISNVEISTSKVEALTSLSEIQEPNTNKLIFRASGTEPGWFAEVLHCKLRLVVDYGKDSLIMESKFENLDSKDGCILELNAGNKTTQKNSMQIINKTCVADGSGDKMDRMVVVSYKGKTYKGCGSFVK